MINKQYYQENMNRNINEDNIKDNNEFNQYMDNEENMRRNINMNEGNIMYDNINEKIREQNKMNMNIKMGNNNNRNNQNVVMSGKNRNNQNENEQLRNNNLVMGQRNYQYDDNSPHNIYSNDSGA